jgi:HPt (histidine-containing phosphotransfer) domain-containing protein
LSNGFDGYISKPIDMRELNTVLNRFIRDKQTPEVIAETRRVIERQKSASLSKSTKKIDDELAAAVIKDIENAIAVLEGLSISDNTDIELFTTTVHGMKSSLANIGETALSKAALKLETAGYKGKLNVVSTETPVFIEGLQKLMQKIKRPETGADVSHADTAFLHAKLHEIKTACEIFDINTAKTVLDELKHKAWPRKTSDLLHEISVSLLRGELKKIVASVEKVL